MKISDKNNSTHQPSDHIAHSEMMKAKVLTAKAQRLVEQAGIGSAASTGHGQQSRHLQDKDHGAGKDAFEQLKREKGKKRTQDPDFEVRSALPENEEHHR